MPQQQLDRIASIGASGESVVQKFFSRAPFVYTVLSAFLVAMFAGGVWTATLADRVSNLEAYKTKLENDDYGHGILEEIHRNTTDIGEQKKKTEKLSLRVFKTDDPM